MLISFHTIVFDRTSDDVQQWLRLMQLNVEYINENLITNNYAFEMSNKVLSCYFQNAELNKRYWYRRGRVVTGIRESKLSSFYKFASLFDKDCKQINDFVSMKGINFVINRPHENDINKLLVFQAALLLNVKFPKTFLLSNLNNFIGPKRLIAKSLNQPTYSIIYQNFKLHMGSDNFIVNISEILCEFYKFLPSLFQEYIDKKYEIRSFYLNGVFKSMAIFSQQNEKTKTDFRNYDHDRPNRCVPYELPKWYEKKLHRLMLKLDINCGSFDIIVTPEDEYYFLEVNPIGQFQWLSKNCNYYIERMIAETLAS